VLVEYSGPLNSHLPARGVALTDIATIELSILRSIPVLQDLDEQDLQALIGRARFITFNSEEVIYEEGEPCNSLWIILSGAVRLLSTAENDGHEIVTASMESGDFFGDEALQPGYERRRTASAIFTETTTLAKLARPDYCDIAHKDEQIIREIKRLGSDQICDLLLQRLEQFHALPLLTSTGDWLEERELVDGDLVYDQGDPADRFYMVTSGLIRLIKRDVSGESLVARLGPGNFFGEQALIRSESRAMRAQSEGISRVTFLSAERFLSLYGQSLEMRSQLQRLSGFCQLAGKGMVTLHITAMYHFADGLKITSTKVVGKPIFSMRRIREPDSAARGWVFERREEGVYRQLTIQHGRMVALIAVGPWGDLGRVVGCISENRRIWPWQLALFQQKGELWLEREQESFAESAVVCRCTGVTRAVLNEAVTNGCDTVEKLAQQTGASRICGSCAPLLAEIVGRSDMDPAELVSIVPVSAAVKSFHFLPRQGRVHGSLPGQHLRIESLIDGRWVQRSYTLSSPAGQQDHYEITVKRESNGLFSRWLHDRITRECAVRVSRPLGDFYLPLDFRDAVVFFAGGIGITPALAMVRSVDQLTAVPAIHIDYSALTRDQFAYADELTDAAQHEDKLHVNLRATEQQGMLDQDDVDQVLQRYPDARFYICGPKPYEDAVRNFLAARGIGSERIRIEHFTPPGGSVTAITSLKGATSLLAGSGLALLLLALFAMLGPFDHQTSVEASPNFEFLWTENTWKQVSGYTAAAVMLAGMGMSFRKRWRRVKFGLFSRWRIKHAYSGVLLLALLFVHTGLSPGQDLNRWFLFAVLATIASGALVGVFTVLENRRPHVFCHRLKYRLHWLHVGLAWPIAALLAIHILTVYYY
jgi:ferredoxin-NADP reductase/CRP-like cAMP-binding protein